MDTLTAVAYFVSHNFDLSIMNLLSLGVMGMFSGICFRLGNCQLRKATTDTQQKKQNP